MTSDQDDTPKTPFSRRALLAASGGAGIAALAGCANPLDFQTEDGGETDENPQTPWLRDAAVPMGHLSIPTANELTTVGVIADPHVSTTGGGTKKMFHQSEDRLRLAVEDMNRRDVSLAIVAGDLTRDGDPDDFESFDEILDGLDAPYAAVPGNHDVPKTMNAHNDPPEVDEFVERYTPDGELPFIWEEGEITVVGIDTSTMPDESLNSTHDGQVSNEQLEWLEEVGPDLDDPILVQHHPTPGIIDRYDDHEALVDGDFDPSTTREVDSLRETMDAIEVPLALSGHWSRPDCAATDIGYELSVPATGSFPQSYLLLDVYPEGTTVWYVPLADNESVVEAYLNRGGDSGGLGHTAVAAFRLAQFPLVNDR